MRSHTKRTYQVIVEGKIVGQYSSHRHYTFAVVAGHDIEAKKKPDGNCHRRANFEYHMRVLDGTVKPYGISKYDMRRYRRERDLGFAAWRGEGVAEDLEDIRLNEAARLCGTHVAEWSVGRRFAEMAAERFGNHPWNGLKNVRVVPVLWIMLISLSESRLNVLSNATPPPPDY
jgi:hypothetical protein